MLMEFEVTAGDIACGKRGDGERCPVALAIRREVLPKLDGLKAVDMLNIEKAYGQVEGWTHEEIDNDLVCSAWYTWVHPAAIENFVYNFDRGLEVMPGKFQIDVINMKER